MISAPQGRSTKTKLVYTVLVVASVLAMGLGYYLEELHKFWAHLSRDIGISGIVGFILAMTFERLSVHEFRRVAEEEREAIKKDVFYYVLGYDIPLPIRDEINTQILQKHYIRRNFKIDFELKIDTDKLTGERFMRTICSMSYDVENLTKDEQDFPLKSAVDKSPSPSLQAKFTSLSVKGAKEPIAYDEEKLQEPGIVDTTSATEIRLEKKILIPPKQMTTVTIEYQTFRYLRGGHLDFAFTSHILDLELTVRVCDPNVEVFASDQLKPTHRNHPGTNNYNWEIDKPLLPYQGIKVTWILKDPTSPGTPPTSKQIDTTAAPPTVKPGERGSKTQPSPAAVQTIQSLPEARPNVGPQTTEQRPPTSDG